MQEENKKQYEIILPHKYPFVTSFPSNAAMFSILTMYPQADPWLYNNFLNLWGLQIDEDNILLRFSPLMIKKICPFLSYNYFGRDFINAHYHNKIVDFFIVCISSGYYIFSQYNKLYIPHILYSQVIYNEHQLFIYGFNKKTREFYVADFIPSQSNKYTFYEASFSNVRDAVNNTQDNTFFVEIFKYQNIDYRFDIDILKREINDFLNSTKSLLLYEESALYSYEKNCIQENLFTFGISNYNLIINNLIKIINENGPYNDIRTFHVLYDHKVLMINRINFLIRNGYIKDNQTLLQKFEIIKDLCLRCRNLFIKYRLTKNKKPLDQIITYIESIKSDEKILMQNLTDYLNEK